MELFEQEESQDTSIPMSSPHLLQKRSLDSLIQGLQQIRSGEGNDPLSFQLMSHRFYIFQYIYLIIIWTKILTYRSTAVQVYIKVT